ncbi:hypothetical protein CDL15_Pgr024498 [Punica granatum]|uniref:Uncharacterized protein n=1 Tax=Punica granatum TaxID=22663 RepID=A0A218XY33_PUNGR|nr:hypothetical protein CDL15_Pgr024498 [Punica granatum]
MGMEPSELKTRSFRYEDYNNRRTFLRSYPLHWDGEEDEEESEEDAEKAEEESKEKRPIKRIILSVITWGEEKVLVLRRVKIKLTVYVIACVPVGSKPSTALISA